MEDPALHIKTLAEKAEQYVRTTAELYKLKAVDKVSDSVSTVSAKIVIIPFAIIFFLMMNLAVAIWLGELLGRMSYGFFIVAGSYGFIGLILGIFGNKLVKTPLRNAIIKFALKIK